MNQVIEFLQDGLNFLFLTIIVKYIVVRWIAEQFVKVFGKLFVKSDREAAIWEHHRYRALQEGHAPKNPSSCIDGNCKII